MSYDFMKQILHKGDSDQVVIQQLMKLFTSFLLQIKSWIHKATPFCNLIHGGGRGFIATAGRV